jgi:hypothetical protein
VLSIFRLTSPGLTSGPLDRSIGCTAALDIVAVDGRGSARVDDTAAGLVAAFKIDVLEIEGMDVAREVAESRVSGWQWTLQHGIKSQAGEKKRTPGG